MEIKRVWKPRSGYGQSGDLAGRARVPCGDNGTPPDVGLSRELWTGRRTALSRQWNGTQLCHKHHGNQWRQCAEHRLEAVRKGQVGQPGATDFGPGVERFSGPCAKGK